MAVIFDQSLGVIYRLYNGFFNGCEMVVQRLLGTKMVVNFPQLPMVLRRYLGYFNGCDNHPTTVIQPLYNRYTTVIQPFLVLAY